MSEGMCSRRLFLGGLLGSVALAGCRSAQVPSVKPKLTLGLLADIHVGDEEGDFNKFGDTATFQHALEWFRDQGVDGVIIAGDMADNGMRSQLKKVGAAWDRVFPANRAPDGRKVEKLFVFGNHDVEGQFYDDYGKRFFDKVSFEAGWVQTDMAGAWEEAFHEPFEPIWMKTVKGYQVVGAHWVPGRWDGIEGVEAWFAKNADRIDRTKPFFFVQHPTPKDTAFGPNVWGHDAGFSTRALSAYPNAVSVSGHCHCPQTDDRFIWQDTFTAISLGSMRYGSSDNVSTLLPAKTKLVNDSRRWRTRQGALLQVYDYDMVLKSRDFLNDEFVREDLIIPIPAAAEMPYRFAPRAAKAAAPAWPSEAKVTQSRADKKVVVTFPSARGPARVMFYVLTVAKPDGTTEDKYALQPNYDLRAVRQPKTVELSFDAAEIPEGSTLSVVPVNCFGRRGTALKGQA